MDAEIENSTRRDYVNKFDVNELLKLLYSPRRIKVFNIVAV